MRFSKKSTRQSDPVTASVTGPAPSLAMPSPAPTEGRANGATP
jgi:hypothetical protein